MHRGLVRPGAGAADSPRRAKARGAGTSPRRRRLLGVVLGACLLGLALPATAESHAPHFVIPRDAAAQVRALFDGVGSGDSAGWSVPSISIRSDHIVARVTGPGGAVLMLTLRRRDEGRDAVARSAFSDVLLEEAQDLDAATARTVAARLGAAVARRDFVDFWQPEAPASGTARPPQGSGPDATVEAERSMAAHRNGVTRAEGLWLAALAGLGVLVLTTLARRWPRRSGDGRRAFVESLVLVTVAFAVRHGLVEAGPGAFHARLPMGDEESLYGPGFGAWIRAFWRIAGTTESAVYLAATVAGSLSVLATYVLGWLGTGRRVCGLAAGLILALWPLHATLSRTDDAATLLGLLLTSALALVVAAERLGAAALLLGCWLAALLAAAVRPEAAAALVPLAALVALSPPLRRLQARGVVLASTGAAGLLAALAVAHGMGEAAEAFEADARPALLDVVKLLGLGGGSVLAPPRTSVVVTSLVLLGLAESVAATRGRVLLWIAVGLLPALPTARLAGPDLLTARYQIGLVGVGAVLAGLGALAVGRLVTGRWPWLRLPLASGAVAVAAALLARAPTPALTFRAEHAYFAATLAAVPESCRIVRVRVPADQGLSPPWHLSPLRGLGHRWVPVAEALAASPQEVAAGCWVYWRPSACHAVVLYDPPRRVEGPPPECALLESRFRLEPLAERWLPSRPGFLEAHLVDPVPVGFYRLQPRDAAPASTVAPSR